MYIIRISRIKKLIGFLAIIEAERIKDSFTGPDISAVETIVITFGIEAEIAVLHIAAIV
jgi:hypothetical protein